ncbi:hypothetical protein [Edaphobacter sp.]|uniref:hypothetical protein n=1 Tax=Edaphobacter sp. TaxID=1934404 RepID=UPI002DBFC1BE|nr:hypothetical protein [Edaphobacter sp.]HEU5340615.1 hypothetical protein [Edaphobacter sp.]
MSVKQARTIAAILGGASMLVLLSGCHVSDNKHGDSDNVKISTPFGGVQVKTDNAAVLEQIGLPQYPGAIPVKSDSDKGSADVNLNFGSFHLKVNAAGYRTTDSPDMVKAFYRKALSKYGDVIECYNYKTVGTPTQTAQGLTCDDHSGGHVSMRDDLTGHTQLKAGSKQNQHIVEIDPEGSGTKFGLVALDLPGHLGSDKNKSSQ